MRMARRMALLTLAGTAAFALWAWRRSALAQAQSPVASTSANPGANPGANLASDVSGRAFAFSFESIDGKPAPLSAYRGRVLMVVNTASKCGFTGQYGALQALWTRHKDDGLVVIGVPSDDFSQEPGSNAEIKGFCSSAFGVTFPLMAKTTVRGREAHPFYQWAARSFGAQNAPRWNFHKYLIGRDGRVIAAFPSSTPPDDPRILAAVAQALNAPAS